MKSITRIVLATLLAVAAIFATVPTVNAQMPARIDRIFYSSAYTGWTGVTSTGIPSGVGSITMLLGDITLPDGRSFVPYATNTPISIDSGANVEVVTPTAVSNCTTSKVLNTCVITATFANAHGAGALVVSGDQGIQEAINDAGNAGGGMVFWRLDPGIVTLNTGGADTSMGTVSIPLRSVVLSASARVTTTIATCAGGWGLGSVAATSNLTATNTTLTAGTTTDSSTLTTQPLAVNAAIIPIVHCTTSNASAGAVHAVFIGYKIVPPLA